ncbi:MAG: alpha-ketoacid dehydrogenase subunit beta [Omnitrophica WOR_2 bacterium]
MTTILDSLNAALHRAMEIDPRVVVLGEDILDPYGGAFKVTRGLSTAFPDRVLTTPISEAAIVGIATGMAMRGLRPVVEIMFGDFLTLAADQLVNHAAKFRWMYQGEVHVPLVVRTPMGGRRGYGPTHSQSLEKLFMGVPGLRVLAPNTIADPGELLINAILNSEDPVLFVENKLLYSLPALDPQTLSEFDVRKTSNTSAVQYEFNSLSLETYTLRLHNAPASVMTITAYGYMADLARQAALKLAYQDEIFVDLVIPSQLVPFEMVPVLDSAYSTRCLLTIEEGSLTLGWGAEIVARAAEALGSRLERAYRLGAQDLPIPSSGPLEIAILPGVDDIITTARRLVIDSRN